MVRFGPFTIDSRTWVLSRDGAPIDLSPRLVQILSHIVERHGEVVTKTELLDRFWPDVNVTENTLTRAIADIRKALGESVDTPTVLQTLARRGYRFMGSAPVDPVMAQLQAWIDGRVALESLDIDRLDPAAARIAQVVSMRPDYAPAHVAMAAVWLMRYEPTRVENAPDRAALECATTSAHSAVSLDASLAEAWATLAHAQMLSGQARDARVSAERAAMLEPRNWRHQYRLALGTWGEERLRASARALELSPSCAAAHLLAGMVFLARGAVDRAADEARRGVHLQTHQPDNAPFPVAGLHWLHGLVACAREDHDAAASAFAQEATTGARSVYVREFRWHALVASGFLHLHGDRGRDAARMFAEASTLVPGSARAVLGLHLCGKLAAPAVTQAIAELHAGDKPVEAALVHAAQLAWTDRVDEAARELMASVRDATTQTAGWNLRADPMLRPLHGLDAFASALAIVAARAA
ncbi:MAG: transcriptional regulator [Acidobacteria bacterium]|nr:transcriptional regulator [Acidobacteriota bacterium]